ncbi:DDE-type integrase/transposase/recombinase [Methanobrevibacter sp.]|uniref:DDE-type integrase/transposase/recombinase n=1 Tax=Methanobrevibacter sp. TaxID=66852 RepID=UPI00389098D6
MSSITQKKRYCPHEIGTRVHAVEFYRTNKDISYTCRKYHISKASLMRWNKQYDGTKESLQERSHRPQTPHPNSHTEEELKWIKDYHRRNPNISICELYGKLRNAKGYSRHPGSLYRIFVKLGYRKQVESTKKKRKHNGKYDTPKELGVKWQMDVKCIPKACYTGEYEDKFYQYTMIDEASRERFIYAYKEQSSHSTVDFVIKSMQYYGYIPKIIQTDNGAEFSHFKKTKMTHSLDILCAEYNIQHKLIRPRAPWHNGKVERSHRNDQERFYNYLKFYSYKDLLIQMKRYLNRSNRIPMQVLNWQSPLEMRANLEVS